MDRRAVTPRASDEAVEKEEWKGILVVLFFRAQICPRGIVREDDVEQRNQSTEGFGWGNGELSVYFFPGPGVLRGNLLRVVKIENKRMPRRCSVASDRKGRTYAK